MSCKPVMLSLPHYLGSSSPWPTFIILSLEGLYLLRWRLAVIVFYTIKYRVCVCVCFHLRTRQSVCVCDKETAGSIDSHGLWDLLPSPFSGAITSLAVKFFVKRPDSRADVCVFVSCVHVWLCVISFCIPPSLQVSVCWCLMGGLQKTLPGRCTWSSTRRTAGEGPSLRWCSLL